MSILEKAWAKLHGSYARTEGGLPCFAANHIMGVAAESYPHSAAAESPEDFFDMIKSAEDRDFTIIAASQDTSGTRSTDSFTAGLAYPVISVHEVKLKRQNLRLLKLLNPWDSDVWRGDWSWR